MLVVLIILIATGLFFLFRHDFGESMYSKSGN